MMLFLVGGTIFGATTAQGQIEFQRPDRGMSIGIDADQIDHWTQGGFEVLHLKGHVRIHQRPLLATGDQAIVWVEIPSEPSRPSGSTDVDHLSSPSHKVIVYLEGQVRVDLSPDGQAVNRIEDQRWLGRLFTSSTVDLTKIVQPLGEREPPPIYRRAQLALDADASTDVRPAIFQSGLGTPDNSGVVVAGNQEAIPWAEQPAPGGQWNQPVLVNPQTGQPLQPPASGNLPSSTMPLPAVAGRPRFDISVNERDANISMTIRDAPNPDNPNERITLLLGGVRVSILAPELAQLEAFRNDTDNRLFISADQVIRWNMTLPDGSQRNQFYLEGNVEFAKGSRVIFAERMFYDVEAQQGTILKAEILTPVQNFNGAVRLKADVIQQLNENQLQAYGAAFTSSRIGVPRYWLQSESLGLQQIPGQEIPSLVYDPEGSVVPNLQPEAAEDQYLVDSRRNRVYVAGVPVFAWPRLQTDLNNSSLYLEQFSINNDRIFGFQVRTGWDLYQLLGRRAPEGTQWTGNLDYLSDRGIGFGTRRTYDRNSLLGLPGRVQGRYESWFINDDGLDFLGRDRRDLVPEEDFRGRTLLKHRHDFAPGYQLRAEIGYITDRNFLEQYYEREWDTEKDATTGFWLERNVGTNSYNLTGDLQLNEFFTQTSGINFEQFTLGQPILNNRIIWHQHSQVGYLRMRQATPPTNAVDAAKFDPLAWETTDVDGIRAGTRHELDIPLQIGPVKVVPYVLGDATYWQEALDGNDLLRVYGQTGVRASLPMWRVDPSIRSVLWNVNGLAHKVSFDVDAFYADASQDLGELPLYDPLDDDAQEHFRRRFAFDTFGILPGGDVPLRYDERNFAFRSGMQGNVTAASDEIADDLSAIRFGVSQRWQTKRGLPGEERIIDWITLDAKTTLYPNADRDNFGSDFGMFDYDFRWYVGDRLSLVSDGYFDFFSQGLRTASVGANISRPEIGNAYLGFRTIEGPISSNIVSAVLAYRMSDKWGVKAGGQVDFGETGSIGQALSLIYIGESFLWQFGFNYDFSRENFGFRFGLEPRFTSRPRLFRPGGVAIPPPSSRWLE